MTGFLASSAAAAAAFAWAARGRASSVFAPSVYHGDRSRARLALTFDDGPTPGTGRLLEVLAYHDTPATFFMCGTNVRRQPAIARLVAGAGHEVANHTDTHPRLWTLSPAAIRSELAEAQRSILNATGHRPTLFRAPYGVRWFGLREAQRQFHLLGVMWTVIGRDWKLDAAAVARRILARAGNGGIICLHDGRELAPAPDIGNTVQAVRRIIPALKDRGFEFTTVSGLLCQKS